MVHAADIHLDSPLRGLDALRGSAGRADARRRRGARWRTWSTSASSEGAVLLLLAGRPLRRRLEGLLHRPLLRGADVAAARRRRRASSWCAATTTRRAEITQNLRWPEHVRELSVRRAGDGASSTTSAWPSTARASPPARHRGPGRRLPRARRRRAQHRPPPHLATGREGHETYAPCRLETLRRKGYDYWALGHVHAREVVGHGAVGGLPRQPPGAARAGDGHEGRDPGHRRGRARRARRASPARRRALGASAGWTSARRPTRPRRSTWCAAQLARAPARRPSGRIAARRGARTAPRARTAALHAARERLRRTRCGWRRATSARDVWVEQAGARARGTGSTRRRCAEQRGAVGELVRSLRALRRRPAALDERSARLAELRGKLPPSCARARTRSRLDDPGASRAALEDVEACSCRGVARSAAGRRGPVRLLELELRAFGPFTERTLDLSTPGRGPARRLRAERGRQEHRAARRPRPALRHPRAAPATRTCTPPHNLRIARGASTTRQRHRAGGGAAQGARATRCSTRDGNPRRRGACSAPCSAA